MRVLSALGIELGEVIGTGGFGAVRRSYDPQLKCELAVKVIPLSKFPHQTFDEYFREAAIMRDARHKHVVPVYYSTQDASNVYLAMPLMAGGSLHQLLEAGAMSVREIVRFGLSLMSGLNHVHTRGLVHLDLTPKNVLLDEAGRAAISDFGIAKYLLPTTGTVENDVFTAPYRAPESLKTLTLTTASDIYQVGVLLYQMAVGSPVFIDQLAGFKDRAALAAAIASGHFPNRGALPFHLPPALASLIKQCLDVDPDRRPKSVFEIINRLSAIEESLDWQPSWDGVQLSLTNPYSGAMVKASVDANGKWSVKAQRGRLGQAAKKAFVDVEGLTPHRAGLTVRSAMSTLDSSARKSR